MRNFTKCQIFLGKISYFTEYENEFRDYLDLCTYERTVQTELLLLGE
jgi:hypothetical protein